MLYGLGVGRFEEIRYIRKHKEKQTYARASMYISVARESRYDYTQDKFLKKIRIPSSSGYGYNCSSVNDIRKQGYHPEQFLHSLTSSCCLQGIQNGLDSLFHGEGLRILCSRDLVFRIPIVSSIPESLSCILDSRTQDFGFYEQRFFEFYQRH